MNGKMSKVLHGISVILALGYMTPTHAMNKDSARLLDAATQRAEAEMNQLSSKFETGAHSRVVNEAERIVAPPVGADAPMALTFDDVILGSSIVAVQP